MAQHTQKEIRAAAAAIANARGNRRGVPAITNILEVLPKKLFDEVMEDAQAALEAGSGAEAKVFSGSIDAMKEVARLQGENRKLLEALAALKNLVNGIDTGTITSDHDETFADAIRKARAAITKATGGQ